MIKILKGILASVIALLLVAMMYVHFNQEGLSRKVLALVRSQLATELTVDAFEVDLLTAFPGVAFEMQDVKLAGSNGTDLIDAKHLRVKVSLLSIFSDNISLRRLTLTDARVFVERLEDGSLSLNVLKPSENPGTGPALDFHRMTLDKVAIVYADPKGKQNYDLLFEQGTIRGGYHGQELALRIDGEVIWNAITLDRDTYLNGTTGSVAGDISLRFEDELYSFDELEISAGDQQCVVGGSIRGGDDHEYLDLTIQDASGNLSSLLALLPESQRASFMFSHMKGRWTGNGMIRGRMNDRENPQIRFDFEAEGADLHSRTQLGVLHNLDAMGTFDNGGARNLKSAELDLSYIGGQARGQEFEATFKLSDFTDPMITCSFEGSLPAEFVLDYAGLDNVKKASGTMHFSGIGIPGLRLSDADLTDVSKSAGTCVLDDVSVTVGNRIVQIAEGTLTLAADTLRLHGLEIETQDDRLSVNGLISGLGLALQSGDVAYLHYAMNVDASRLNLSTWVPALAAHDEATPHARSVSEKASAPLRMPGGEMKLSIVKLRCADMDLDAVEALVRTQKHQAHFEAAGHVAGGKLNASGDLQTAQGYHLKLRLMGDQLKVRECFAECRDFGQGVIRSEHLHGLCDIRVLADIPWSIDGRLLNDEIHVLAGMAITDGELVGFEMLEQFSSYVHAEDLRRIKFDRIDNFIEVSNGRVYIPVMFIRSNAANLVVNGVHHLDNRILYNLKMNAGQVLSSKMRRHDPTLTPLPARRDGTFNLFFTIAGTTETFSTEMNRRGVESSFAQSEEMRLRIRDELRKAFGETIDLIEPPDWETIPEYDLEVEGEDTFLEWRD